MPISVPDERQPADHEQFTEGDTVEVIYQRNWFENKEQCQGTIKGILGERTDKAIVIDPQPTRPSAITVHAYEDNTGTVDGKAAHDILLLKTSE